MKINKSSRIFYIKIRNNRIHARFSLSNSYLINFWCRYFCSNKIVNCVQSNIKRSGLTLNIMLVLLGTLTHNLCQGNHNNWRQYGPHSFYDYNNVIRCKHTPSPARKLNFHNFFLLFGSHNIQSRLLQWLYFGFGSLLHSLRFVVVNFYFHFFYVHNRPVQCTQSA